MWENVSNTLKEQGHTVLVPDVMANAQENNPMEQAAAKLAADIEAEPGDEKVVLAGHSMGAIIAALAAPHIKTLEKVVFIDGSLPKPGTALWDCFPSPQQEWLLANTSPKGKIAPPPTEGFGIDSGSELGSWLGSRLTPHDIAWFKAKVPAKQDLTGIPGSFVHCTNHPSPITSESAERAKEWGMSVHPLAADHLPMLTHSHELSQLLGKIIATP